MEKRVKKLKLWIEKHFNNTNKEKGLENSKEIQNFYDVMSSNTKKLPTFKNSKPELTDRKIRKYSGIESKKPQTK